MAIHLSAWGRNGRGERGPLRLLRFEMEEKNAQ